jgi:Protein of unknown function (DUF992)
MVDRYVGHIDKFGVDFGYRAGGLIAWAVVAPNPLTGTYTGLTGGAAFGVGAGANLHSIKSSLIGGCLSARSVLRTNTVIRRPNKHQ